MGKKLILLMYSLTIFRIEDENGIETMKLKKKNVQNVYKILESAHASRAKSIPRNKQWVSAFVFLFSLVITERMKKNKHR